MWVSRLQNFRILNGDEMKFTLYIKTYSPNVDDVMISTANDLLTLFNSVNYDEVEPESFYVVEYPSGKVYYA